MRELKKFIPESSVVTRGFYKTPFEFEGTILQVVVMPPDPNTLYNFGIKDEDGFVIFSKFDVRGNLVASELDLVLFPGQKWVILEGARTDGVYRIKLVYQL